MTSRDLLDRLRELWNRERHAARERFRMERRGRSLAERVTLGLALRDLEVDEAEAVPGGRVRLWLTMPDPGSLDDLRIAVGDPVRLYWQDPDEEGAFGAVASRRDARRLSVVVDGDPPERVWDGGVRLDREAPESTFDRGDRALARVRDARDGTDLARLREVLFGTSTPRFSRPEPTPFFDEALNAPQREAVARALSAEDVALVHGPPGTGKTRTLVEIVRQAVERGERVLVTAASNTAVDNLAERLVEVGVPLVRLGHPARVSSAIEGRTLDALVESSDAFALARTWMSEASALRRTAERRFQRGSIHRRERRGMQERARDLVRDAKKQLDCVEELVLARCPVVCATASGADLGILRRTEFDRVVLDEATQAPDPIGLVALARARRAVLAGDPCQLPPTVVDRQAALEGLATTAFERLLQREPSAVSRLVVQHRMHAVLMQFPSESMYEGRLRAAAAVESHRLEDRNVASDPGRAGPLVLIDTAGRGWEEERTGDDPSTRNPAQADRVAAEVRRLIARGLPPADVAVITPYEAQARILRERLASERREGLEVGTVDGFQGREKEAIVVDLVRSNDEARLGFLEDVRRMNVAITRARRFLLVVGDTATFGAHPYYAALLRHVERAGIYLSAWED